MTRDISIEKKVIFLLFLSPSKNVIQSTLPVNKSVISNADRTSLEIEKKQKENEIQ